MITEYIEIDAMRSITFNATSSGTFVLLVTGGNPEDAAAVEMTLAQLGELLGIIGRAIEARP